MIKRLAIGKNSDGSDFYIVVNATNTFISYYKDEQFIRFAWLIISNFESEQDVRVQITLPFSLQSNNLPEKELKLPLQWNDKLMEMGLVFTDIFSEFTRRIKICEKNNFASAELLVQKKGKPFIFIIVKDMWSMLVMAQNNKVRVRKLLQMLLLGHRVGLYFICGSVLSFRHLLTQLMDNNPRLMKLYPGGEKNIFPTISVLGNEIVYTADGTTFFKNQFEMEYRGLY